MDQPSTSFVIVNSDDVFQEMGTPIEDNIAPPSSKTGLKWKILGFIIFYLLVAAVSVAITYYLIPRPVKEIEVNVKLCESKNCLRAALDIKELADFDSNPCDDFYKYACGNFINKSSHKSVSELNDKFLKNKVAKLLEDDYPIIDGYTNLSAINKAKVFYKSCIIHQDSILNPDLSHKSGYEKIYAKFHELQLPSIANIFIGESVPKNRNLMRTLALVRRTLGIDPLFITSVVGSLHNDSEFTLAFLPPEKPLMQPDYILKIKQLMSYQRNGSQDYAYMFNTIKQIFIDVKGQNALNGPLTLQNFNKSVARVFEFKKRFDNKTSVRLASLPITDANYLTVDQLQNLTDNYLILQNMTIKHKDIWKTFVKTLMMGNENFNISDRILVVDKQRMEELAVILAHEDESLLLESLIWWKIIDFSLFHTTSSAMNSKTRRLHCTEKTMDLMPFAVSELIINRSFYDQNGLHEKLLNIFTNIKLSFNETIQKSDWLDKGLKEIISKKLHHVRTYFGYPQWLLNTTTIDEYYANVSLTKDSFFQNYWELTKLKSSRQLGMHAISKNVFEEKHFDPTYAGAFYVTTTNSFYLGYAGLLLPSVHPKPGYDIEVLNYASYGAMIGHELLRGFDKYGIKYNKNSSITQNMNNKYDNKATCYSNQYTTLQDIIYKNTNTSIKNSHDSNLDENIADNQALIHSYAAYQLWKKEYGKESKFSGFSGSTSEQLFFLRFAQNYCEKYGKEDIQKQLSLDPHSLGRLRIIGSIQNHPKFSKAYNCKVDAFMNPKKKCKIW